MSSQAFTLAGLCLKKEVSNNGVNWFDANSESEAATIADVAHFRIIAFKCDEAWGGL